MGKFGGRAGQLGFAIVDLGRMGLETFDGRQHSIVPKIGWVSFCFL